MKKTFMAGLLQCVAVLAIMFAGMFTMASCDDEQKISYGKLPAAARTFIETYFPGLTCVYAEKEREDGANEYTVVLSDSTEIEFDSAGQWTSVDCKFSLLPAGIVPAVIVEDIAVRYPQAGIYKASRKLGGYEISIGSGLELIYSAAGQFIREDRF